MIKKIVLITFAALIVFSVVGCGDMLNAQAAKDRDLGDMVKRNLETSVLLSKNFVDFELEKAGVYKLTAKGLADGQAVGSYGYNVLATLDERNNSVVKCGRTEFTVNVWQDGKHVAKITIAAGVRPSVTLMGPYEGETWVKK